MTREEILDCAKECVCRSRERDYNGPENNFRNIALLWTVYLNRPIEPKDVAMMMVLLKVGRTMTGNKMDNFVDIAGYAACAGEIVDEANKVVSVKETAETMKKSNICAERY